MRRDRPWPTNCDRCGDRITVSGMSFFNEDICCLACLDDEKEAPTYASAKAAEAAAVQRGDYNFSAGLTHADSVFLAARRASRVVAGRARC